jgi:hypothetical protein
MGRKRKADIELPDGRLWPNSPSGSPVQIEVFGATGDYKSGKTILGLSLAPGVHPAGHPFEGKPRTLILDCEKSAGTYGGTGCERIDVPRVMAGLMKTTYLPLDVFEWFLVLLAKIEEHQFDVIMVDPVTDLEAGLVDYVKKNHAKFGLTANQMSKAGGLMWAAVKDYWKQLLLKLSTRCQTFYFTSHLRAVWSGDRPVPGKREPKGKETLMELASLYLWLERKPDESGKVAAEPAAKVLKERLADTRIVDGALQIVPLMPPRLPVATVQEIRGYIARPPDYGKLRDGERVTKSQLSEDEKLVLQSQIAADQAAAGESHLTALAQQSERKAAAKEKAKAAPQNSDQTAALQAAKEKGEKLDANRPGSIEKNQQEQIVGLKAELEMDTEAWRKLLAKANVHTAADLSRKQGQQLIDFLSKQWKEKQDKDNPVPF